MEVDSRKRAIAEAPTRCSQKAYRPPELTTFGKLHLRTQGSAGDVGDGMASMSMTMSDRRAKENIVRIGTHPMGVGLYLFDYKREFHGSRDGGRHLGVMADEVEQVLPQAVTMDPDGYKRVDYSMLGIELRQH